MTFSNTGSVLATLTQVNFMGALTSRVKSLPVPELVCLLDFITAEFQQFIRAMDLINNEALETLLEQLLDAFTVKIGQILQADRTTIFLVDSNKNQLWHKTVDAQTGEDSRSTFADGCRHFRLRSNKRKIDKCRVGSIARAF
jgi:adenylate/guanylate cyclase